MTAVKVIESLYVREDPFVLVTTQVRDELPKGFYEEVFPGEAYNQNIRYGAHLIRRARH